MPTRVVAHVVHSDAPYGSEKAYNALRLTLQREQADIEIRVFLMGDAALAVLPDQSTPQGYYNIERMFKPGPARRGVAFTSWG